ncbi:MAG TPA: hypothetical protein VF169_18510 [Albitalea sp.]|uniref:hypothetical protein n=1 Tax=Piscinibacter sp. TaxID=1903157 RepID=UPI002ED58F98
MQVDALALDLRPRSRLEASDLGVRLVQSQARSVWGSFLPLYAVVVALALATAEISPWLPALSIYWLKPWLDRSLLFVLSRSVFGQTTRFADLWRARREVWGRSLLATLVTRRFSPWRSFTGPLLQLEEQRGQALRWRRRQLLRGQRGAAFAMQAAFAQVELLMSLGVIALLAWFEPNGHPVKVLNALSGDGLAGTLIGAGLYAAVVGVLEPFYVAAGFAMYLNRRVELEAWDIEQEFRRVFAR